MRRVGGWLRNTGRALASVSENRDLIRVAVAFLFFRMMETGTWISILVFAFERGGAAETGIVAVIQLLPAAVIAPFVAGLGDRYRRDRVLLLSYILQALTMGGVGAAMLGGAPAPLVYALAAVAAVPVTITRPVQGALMPQLASTPTQLAAANGLTGTVESVAALVGSVATGLLLAAGGPGLAIAVLAGVLLLLGAVPVAALTPQVRPERIGTPGIGEALEGFRSLARQPGQRLIVGLVGGKSIVVGALDVLVVVLALDVLDLGRGGAGYLNAALGVGGVVGGALAVSLAGRRRLAPALGGGIVLYGIPVAAMGLASLPTLAMSLLVAGGAGYTVADVAGRTLLQRVAPNEVLARVFGVLEGLHIGGLAAGSILAPLLMIVMPAGPAVAIVGLLLPVTTVLLWKRIRAVDLGVDVPVRELALLRATSVFSSLPIPALEGLAKGVERVETPDGQVVIREGDAGDRFYVVEEGEVEVSKDGAPIRKLGRGAGFGEIALLRDVPRTATVTAHGPVKLLAVERDDFLQAVTGHPVSRAAAEGMAGARLTEQERRGRD